MSPESLEIDKILIIKMDKFCQHTPKVEDAKHDCINMIRF